ncbi:MAG: YgiT-type zinc finger protein, partial [Prochloron sp. SP5CPC1]|nr:YgiT-type zinc finger protein [Candidatus Paraprochloron terpiosi SP5CPC1]
TQSPPFFHLCPVRRTHVDLGSGMVVVRHMPARVCQQCGEDWIEDSVAAHRFVID